MTSSNYKTSNYKTSSFKTSSFKKRNVPKGMIRFFLLLISKIKSLLPLNLPRMNKGVNKKDYLILKSIISGLSYIIAKNFFLIFIKNIAISFIIIVMAAATPIYFITPPLFEWEMVELGIIDVLPLEIFENVEKNQKKLIETEIITENLEKELSKAISSKEELIEIKYESVNWWTVILAISGITIISGVSAYLLLNGSDGEFFKTVILNVVSQSNNLVELITNNDAAIKKNLLLLIEKLRKQEDSDIYKTQ